MHYLLHFVISYMAQKLQAFVQDECPEEDPDNIMFHEAALPGHILLLLLKVYSLIK